MDPTQTPDQSAPASAPAPQQTDTPPATPPIPSSVSSGAPPATPAPSQPNVQGPKVLVPEQQGGLAGVVSEIRNALAPHEQNVYRDPETGQRFVHDKTATPGQQWRQIAGEAIRGAAAGFAAGKGAGNMGKAAEAGVQEGVQEQEKQKQQANAQSDEDYEIARQNRMDKANTYMQQLDAAQKIFALKRLQGEYTHEQTTWAQQANADEKTAGSVDLGVYPDHFSLPDVQKQHPEIQFWKTAVNGGMHVHPEVDDNGKIQGVHLWMPVADTQDQAVPPGTKAMRVDYDDKGVPHLEQFTPTGQQTTRTIKSYNDAANSQMMAWQTGQQETKLKDAQTRNQNAEATEHTAAAGKDSAESKQLNEATDNATVQSNAQQIVEGTMDPSNLSKRAKSYDATLAAANAYSMQTTGKPFDIAKAISDYKYATQPGTQNTLKYINSLTGRNNDGGNLSVAIDASNKVKRTNYPPLNAADEWAKLSAGNTDVANFYSAALDVQDQVAKILQGGGTGSGSTDAKLKAAGQVLNKNFNPQQFASSATIIRQLLANRKTELIGDNRYLARWGTAYAGTAPTTPQNGAQPSAPQQVTIQPNEPQIKLANGNIGVARNGAWVDTGRKAGQ